MKTNNKKNLRKCIICNEYKNKNELNRITKDCVTSEILVNNDNKIFGRSFYICKSPQCIQKALEEKNCRKYFRSVFDFQKKEEFLKKLIF